MQTRIASPNRLTLSALAFMAFIASSAVTGAAAQMQTGAAMKSFAAIDTDRDGKLTRAELSAAAGRDFDRLDIDHDGYLTAGELDRTRDVTLLLPFPGRFEARSAFAAADTDHDRKIDKHEYETAVVRAYMSCDANHDGTIELSDLKRCAK